MGDKTMKIIKSPKRAEGKEKVMQTNSQKFKTCAQKYMSNTCLVFSSLSQVYVTIN